MSRTITYVHVYIILDFPIAYTKSSVFYQSKCVCLHKTVNMAVSFLNIMKIPTQRESTHENVQSCPSIGNRDLINSILYEKIFFFLVKRCPSYRTSSRVR